MSTRRDTSSAADGGPALAAPPRTESGNPGARIVCLIPPRLAGIEEAVRDLYGPQGGVEVIVERRRCERRRAPERRLPLTEEPQSERRRVHNRDGRRVGERRAPQTLVEPSPQQLEALPARGELVHCRVAAPSQQELEDRDTARLVVGLQSGEEGAFDRLYERYLSRIYGYLCVALRDRHEAEDLAHEVFVKVLEALPSYELRGVPFRVWLFRIVRNHTLNHLAKHARVTVEDPAALDRRREAPSQSEAELIAGLEDNDLLALLDDLPLAQRQVLLLRHVLGFSAGEAADLLERTPNAVSLLQRRAFEVLRERLRPAQPADAEDSERGALPVAEAPGTHQRPTAHALPREQPRLA